ncbi:MAG: cytochrome c4 [Burkholderiales bacterium]|jgi:cytochrome c553|nr:cytochrome c4 [Burkholderiales bacterium]
MKTLFTLCVSAVFAMMGSVTWAADEIPAKAATCLACHGVNGNSTMPGVPSLAAQNARYIYLQLRDYQEGRRDNPMMSPMAAGLTRPEMQELANYFSQQKLSSKGFKADPDKVKKGIAKADETLCAMCHLGEFKGQNEIPKVAGQNFDYVVSMLKAFKAKTRTNDAGNMTSVASTLSDEDIENLGHYIAGLN